MFRKMYDKLLFLVYYLFSFNNKFKIRTACIPVIFMKSLIVFTSYRTFYIITVSIYINGFE